MSALTVKLPKDELSTSIALVAHYCGEGESLQLVPDAPVEEPQLRTKPFGKDYTTIAGHNTVCRFIASSSKAKAQLLGRTPEDAAMISEWLSYRNTSLLPLMDDKLIKVRHRGEHCSPTLGTSPWAPFVRAFAAVSAVGAGAAVGRQGKGGHGGRTLSGWSLLT